MNQSPTILGNYRFFEELIQVVPEWELDFVQLGRAHGPYQLVYQPTRASIFARSAFGSAFRQAGASPAGFRTFGVTAPGSTPLYWHGECLDEQGMIVMPRGGEFNSRSDPGLDLINVSVSEAALRRVAAEDYGEDLDDLLSIDRIFCKSNSLALARVRALFCAQSRRIEHSGAGFAPALDADYLARSLLRVIGEGRPSLLGAATARSRLRLVEQALKVIDAKQGRLSVPELAAELDVARRTVEYAFDEVLRISPASYIKRYRLQNLRSELLAVNGDRSVGALARELGFRHGGQLAADYAGVFGESPLQTLKRCA